MRWHETLQCRAGSDAMLDRHSHNGEDGHQSVWKVLFPVSIIGRLGVSRANKKAERDGSRNGIRTGKSVCPMPDRIYMERRDCPRERGPASSSRVPGFREATDHHTPSGVQLEHSHLYIPTATQSLITRTCDTRAPFATLRISNPPTSVRTEPALPSAVHVVSQQSTAPHALGTSSMA